MTTESKQQSAPGGSMVLLRSGAVALTAVLMMAVLAAMTTGSTGSAGAMTGGVVALLVFLGGSLVVNVVARVMPGLSLVFALSTYVLQVLVIGMFFSVVGSSDLMGGTLHAGWLAAAIVGVTVVWLGVQVLLASRARIPLYDLPSKAGER